MSNNSAPLSTQTERDQLKDAFKRGIVVGNPYWCPSDEQLDRMAAKEFPDPPQPRETRVQSIGYRWVNNLLECNLGQGWRRSRVELNDFSPDELHRLLSLLDVSHG